jgi:EAL domain-containing protein (putative c-di-GMP-specific phosphodiesterase class I)
LNIDLIAIGVENINQEEILKELGCTEAQGFFYAPPQPFDGL